jgi:hypothetical protein
MAAFMVANELGPFRGPKQPGLKPVHLAITYAALKSRSSTVRIPQRRTAFMFF